MEQVFEIERQGRFMFGTFGYAVLRENGEMLFECWTVERPWANNTPRVSCIPAGSYRMKPRRFFRHDYEAVGLVGVPGRDHILIHIANFPTDVIGCIGLGERIDRIGGELGVTNSERTFNAFMSKLQFPALCIISDAAGTR